MAYPIEATEEDKECIDFCSAYSMTSIERLFATRSAVKYIVKNRIPGALAECGVWKGGNAMIMARTLIDLNDVSRDIFLFDTFSGMTEPDSCDCDFSGATAADLLRSSRKSRESTIWCVANEADVRSNLSSTGYSDFRLKFIVGDVLTTLDDELNLPRQLALLRLDTDWYQSTRKEMEVLFPRLVRGGVCIIDDYGHWQGSRRAIDDYLRDNQIFPLIHITDFTGRVFIKT